MYKNDVGDEYVVTCVFNDLQVNRIGQNFSVGTVIMFGIEWALLVPCSLITEAVGQVF